MPRKTKKDKIIAQYRHRLNPSFLPKALHQYSSDSQTTNPRPELVYNLKYTSPLTDTPTSKASQGETTEYLTIRADLQKTLILSVFAVILELLLTKFI